MSLVSPEEVRAFVLEQLVEPLKAKSLEPHDVPDNFDLLTEGVIDSLGILEMVSALEERFGLEVDFEDLDPDDLTKLGPFSSYVATRSVDGGRST